MGIGCTVVKLKRTADLQTKNGLCFNGTALKEGITDDVPLKQYPLGGARRNASSLPPFSFVTSSCRFSVLVVAGTGSKSKNVPLEDVFVDTKLRQDIENGKEI